jgi:peptide/nickel transport system substrate-binding protein
VPLHSLTRRDSLRLMGSVAATSLLAACAPAAPQTPAAPAPTLAAKPTAAPAATSAAQAPAPTATTGPPAAAPKPTASAQGAPKPGGTLRVGMIGDLANIEGHQITQATVNVTFLVFDRLIEYDTQLQPQPSLAESWDVSSDMREITFRLRRGVQFHTGREFTSEDVKYNLLRVRDPKVAGLVGQLGGQSAWWTTIDTPDKNTLVLKSEQPRPGMFDFFEYFNILDRETLESANASTKAVGTGPFTFVEWAQGDHFTFAKNTNYWQPGRPYLDQINIRIFKDAQAQIVNLEAGALDLADSPPVRDVTRLRQDPNYQLVSTFIGGQYFCLFCNTTQAPFDNKVVRQALNYAIDRQRFADTVLLGLVGPGQDLPWPPQAGASEPAKNNIYAFDLDKARSLLASAGVSNLEFELLFHNLAYPTEYAALAQMYQADLAKIGVNATLKLLDFPSLFDTLTKLTYNGMAIAGGAYAHLAESSTIFTTGRAANLVQGNWSGYKDEALSNLVSMSSTEPDAAKRKALYSQINDRYLDEVFNLPVALYPAMSLTRSKLHGVSYNLLPGLNYTNAWLE